MIVQATEQGIRQAVELLRAGDCVGMPTETVYGLAGDALNPAALARIFEIKQRPLFDPLILHVAAGYELSLLVREIPEAARELMEGFWPGPLTLLLSKRDLVPDLATSGLSTVALRCPVHPVAQQLLKTFGGPLAAPSANRFGRISPTRAQAVEEELGAAVKMVLEGGPCAIGVESTIVDATQEPPRILRPGAVSLEELPGCVLVGSLARVEAPGMLQSHYAPRTPLYRVEGVWPQQASFPAEAAVLRWSQAVTGARTQRVLTPDGRPAEAAANLFLFLRELDACGARFLLAEEVPRQGLGFAIHDRLERASVGRARWNGDGWVLEEKATGERRAISSGR